MRRCFRDVFKMLFRLLAMIIGTDSAPASTHASPMHRAQASSSVGENGIATQTRSLESSGGRTSASGGRVRLAVCPLENVSNSLLSRSRCVDVVCLLSRAVTIRQKVLRRSITKNARRWYRDRRKYSAFRISSPAKSWCVWYFKRELCSFEHFCDCKRF